MSVKYRLSAAAVVVAIGLLWLLVRVGASFQAALETVAAVIAALATTWSAYQSRRAAEASAGIARDARLALALHNRPWLQVHLLRKPGPEGTPWTWVVILAQGDGAARIRLFWTLDGIKREASRDRLRQRETWEPPTYVESGVAADHLHAHVGNVEIEYEDLGNLMRWRSRVTVDAQAAEGTFTPYDDETRTIRSVKPFVSTTQPEPIW